jgi:protein TonB
VIRSSGDADLDGTTCQLIERRYRYRPALDAEGRPVPEDRIWKQIWWIEGDRD